MNCRATRVGGTLGQHVAPITSAFTNLEGSTPGFGLFLLATGIVVGTFLLWCELIVRRRVDLAVRPRSGNRPALYVSLGSATGLAPRRNVPRCCVSKFLIVITLSLGFDELPGSSATQIITGAVTLVVATFSPFILLRDPLRRSSRRFTTSRDPVAFHSLGDNDSSSPVGTAARALGPSPTPGRPHARTTSASGVEGNRRSPAAA